MDNLENFFREKAQYHNIEYNEKDWQKLKVQLDKEMPVTFSILSILKKYWYFPLLILTIPLTWLVYTQSFEKEPRIEARNSSSHKSEVPGFLDNDPPNSPKITTMDNEVIEERESETTGTEIHKKVEESTESTEMINQPTSTEPVDQDLIPDNSSIGSASLNDKKKLETKDKNTIGYAVFENGVKTIDNAMDSELHFLPSLVPETAISTTISSEIKSEEKESVTEITPKQSNKININLGIGYSPDFSTVGIKNFTAPGSRWTATFDVGISKRFEVQTGVVWIMNKYEAFGEDYHAPQGYWGYGISADKTYGECIMIDIPLNLKYNIFTNTRHVVFLSGGASTYLLLKEDYYFSYEYYDPDLPTHWGADETTVYPFGIINFSVGYQYRFGKKSSLQVEPFIKIPTSGIGWGKVNLHTLGTYFIYKYRIGK